MVSRLSENGPKNPEVLMEFISHLLRRGPAVGEDGKLHL
jgi:hypothetical protein